MAVCVGMVHIPSFGAMFVNRLVGLTKPRSSFLLDCYLHLLAVYCSMVIHLISDVIRALYDVILLTSDVIRALYDVIQLTSDVNCCTTSSVLCTTSSI